MTTRGSFSISNLEEYLEKIAAAGNDVDEACAEALDAAAPIVTAKMHEDLKATSEHFTGATDATIAVSSVQREGNYNFVKVTAGGPPAVQAFYKEYGTVHFAAEPFFRTGFTLRRHMWRNKVKEVLKEKGFTS